MPRSEGTVKLPTLETGISIPKPAPAVHAARTGDSQRGFTLWELLIVVAIVAVTISMLQFSTSLGDSARDLKRVGTDLGKLFHLLNQEAVFENRNYAISVQEGGFIVLEYMEGNWVPVEDTFYTRIKMTGSQSSELIIEDQVIDTSKKTIPQPHILILSSGEMTPFE